MNSNSGMRGIRQVRRKKSSLSEVKLVILGAPGVGKSGIGFIIIIFLLLLLLSLSSSSSSLSLLYQLFEWMKV